MARQRETETDVRPRDRETSVTGRCRCCFTRLARAIALALSSGSVLEPMRELHVSVSSCRYRPFQYGMLPPKKNLPSWYLRDEVEVFAESEAETRPARPRRTDLGSARTTAARDAPPPVFGSASFSAHTICTAKISALANHACSRRDAGRRCCSASIGKRQTFETADHHCWRCH